MLRTNKNDFRSNFSLGGNAEKSTLSESEKNLIDSVLKVLKFDFAGIDIIYKNNRPYINEIEDVVGSRMVYANTDIDIIKLYLDYIKEKYENE
jgi:glutathione synthase/RimK-type ligase-like ATP-grasp enzyme